jgi:hypothetical protein
MGKMRKQLRISSYKRKSLTYLPYRYGENPKYLCILYYCCVTQNNWGHRVSQRKLWVQVALISYQKYQNGAVINQLTEAGRRLESVLEFIVNQVKIFCKLPPLLPTGIGK